jgi:HEPN domain-containing protein
MKQRAQEWIDKAEGDWTIAQRERQAANPVWDGICFLAQQCAEKYLKAFLEEHGIPFAKTHDLVYLLGLAGGQFPALDALRSQLARLSIFGIAARYPGTWADQVAADEALQTAELVRAVVRAALGIQS